MSGWQSLSAGPQARLPHAGGLFGLSAMKIAEFFRNSLATGVHLM